MASLRIVLLVALVLAVSAAFLVYVVRHHRAFGTPAEVATFETLHLASLAAPSLRAGLTPEGARRAIKHLHALLGTAAVALTDTERLLSWAGGCTEHASRIQPATRPGPRRPRSGEPATRAATAGRAGPPS